MKERRPRLVEEHPELSHIDISKKIGEEWKAMPAEEKQVSMHSLLLFGER